MPNSVDENESFSAAICTSAIAEAVVAVPIALLLQVVVAWHRTPSPVPLLVDVD